MTVPFDVPLWVCCTQSSLGELESQRHLRMNGMFKLSLSLVCVQFEAERLHYHCNKSMWVVVAMQKS